jgi:putative transposase
MSQSLCKVILHVIFSTKDRKPWLDSNVRPRMHAYVATICRDLGADFVHVGGVPDHVHVLTTLARTLSQAQFIEQIKKPLPNGSRPLTRGIGAFLGSVVTAHFR